MTGQNCARCRHDRDYHFREGCQAVDGRYTIACPCPGFRRPGWFRRLLRWIVGPA